MRDHLERVTIVLTKEQHQRFREFSKKCHGSLSQFLRMAAENETDQNKDAYMVNFRPIIKKLETLEGEFQQIIGKIQKIERGTDYAINRLGSRYELICEDIENLLLEKGIELSIPEIGNYLPYTQEEVISGIEKLEERFSLIKIERNSAPSKWKIRGCNV